MSIFANRDVFVFDLDNTLYPAEHDIYTEIGARMTHFIGERLALSPEEAHAVRERYYNTYGATVVGLMRHHEIDPASFMSYVHDVAIDSVHPDPALGALIGALPGRRIVFTNGDRAYARRIVAQLGFGDLFEQIIALEDLDWTPKPEPEAFQRMCAAARIDPLRAVMFEDHTLNAQTAHRLGFLSVLVGPDAALRPPLVDHCAPTLESLLRSALTGGHCPPTPQA
jgi:putative hydrolase of the HAD superfamily